MPALLPLSINLPGGLGINTEEDDQTLSPQWATVLDGFVLDKTGRIAARGGFTHLTTSSGPDAVVKASAWFVEDTGTPTFILQTGAKFFSYATNAVSDITGSATVADQVYQLLNFNGFMLGFAVNTPPVQWAGSGNFADITVASGTIPDGGVACAAFGRVWALTDNFQIIKYSALLDHTRWDAADGAGSIDMRNIWTLGMDLVTAIAAFGSTLVVFGRKHIVFFTDGSGSVLGVDPEQMYVVDTIEGTGCAARDTVQNIGEGDLVFLSQVGVQSLKRLIINKDNPLETVSWQVDSEIKDLIKNSSGNYTASYGRYIPSLGQYVLSINDGTSVAPLHIFHFGNRTQDDKGRQVVPVVSWTTASVPTGFLTTTGQVTGFHENPSTGVIHCTQGTGSSSEVYLYNPAASHDLLLGGASGEIAVNFESGWLATGDPNFDFAIKVLKGGQFVILNPKSLESFTNFKYGTDYKTTLNVLSGPFARETRLINQYDTMGDVEGQYFKFGLTDLSFGQKALAQVTLYLSPARTAQLHARLGQTTDETTVVTGPQILQIPVVEDVDASGVSSVSVDIPISSEADGALILIGLSGSAYAGTVTANYAGTGDVTLLDVGGFAATFNLRGGLVVFSGAPTSQSLLITGSIGFGTPRTLTVQIIPIKDITGSSTVDEDYDAVVDSNDAAVQLNENISPHKSQILVVLRRSNYTDSAGTDYELTETQVPNVAPDSPVYRVTATPVDTATLPNAGFVTSFDFTCLSVVSRVLVYSWEDASSDVASITWDVTQKNIGASGANELYATLYRPT